MIKKLKVLLGLSKKDVMPIVQNTPLVSSTTFSNAELGDWYPPVNLPVSQIGAMALSPDSLQKVFKIIDQLEQDTYTRYVKAFCDFGRANYKAEWKYADIATALFAAAHFVKPENYLEIGVRKGRSLAVVAASNPNCQIVAFDIWPEMYANMPNPGPEFASKEIKKIGFAGKIEFVNGDSHLTLPAYFMDHPDAFFDLVTVDGDHSREGARQDLIDILPRIKVGGVLVFDDISHPLLPHLREVWNEIVAADFNFATWEYSELGFGVAIAIRRSV